MSQRFMEGIVDLLWLPWTVCVLFLVASVAWKKERWGIVGDVLLLVSFSLTACALLWLKSYWYGAACLFPAVRQAYVLFKSFHRNRANAPLTQTELLEKK